jgi:hypothetical protein
MKYNPDWDVRFYYPKYPQVEKSWVSFEQKYDFEGKDFLLEVMKLPIKKIEVDFSLLGIKNSLSEVYKSDFLRLHLLSTVGGLWSDMDILYFNPITNASFNIPKNSNIDTTVCICDYGHSIGFMLSSANNIYYRYLWEMSLKYWDDSNYQSIGATLLNRNFPNVETATNKFPNLKTINISMDTVYAYNASNIKSIFKSKQLDLFTSNSVGLHWYAGHPLAGKFLCDTDGGLKCKDDCVMSIILNKIKEQ